MPSTELSLSNLIPDGFEPPLTMRRIRTDIITAYTAGHVTKRQYQNFVASAGGRTLGSEPNQPHRPAASNSVFYTDIIVSVRLAAWDVTRATSGGV